MGSTMIILNASGAFVHNCYMICGTNVLKQYTLSSNFQYLLSTSDLHRQMQQDINQTQ